MYEELGIGEQIDQVIAQDRAKRQVSLGQAVKAMVLNGLGLVNQRLYLVPKFFGDKPTQRLVGDGMQPEQLNDDVLGWALDALYEFGVTERYALIAPRRLSGWDCGSVLRRWTAPVFMSMATTLARPAPRRG